MTDSSKTSSIFDIPTIGSLTMEIETKGTSTMNNSNISFNELRSLVVKIAAYYDVFSQSFVPPISSNEMKSLLENKYLTKLYDKIYGDNSTTSEEKFLLYIDIVRECAIIPAGKTTTIVEDDADGNKIEMKNSRPINIGMLFNAFSALIDDQVRISKLVINTSERDPNKYEVIVKFQKN